jgi:glycosyltransferase involved in cell wall biosynthesis
LSLDKLLASCATHLLADSESQKVFLEVNKVAKKGKIRVLGNGSISGVDSNRFSANPSVRFRIRQELGLKDNDVVFLFLGRVARAKGVVDLAYAFSKLAKQFDNAYLFVVGPDDDGLDQELDSILLTAGGRHHREGFTDTPEEWMAASDIFCLPSYREGFGMAVVEAASVGIPAIVSRTYGLIDAVDEDKTGIFHAPGDREEIYRCMKKLFEDPVTRAQLAGQARQRAVMSFSEKYVTDEMTCYIESILE